MGVFDRRRTARLRFVLLGLGITCVASAGVAAALGAFRPAPPEHVSNCPVDRQAPSADMSADDLVQANAEELFDRMRATPSMRYDTVDLAFGTHGHAAELAVRNHDHDRAIRACADNVGLLQRDLAIVIHHITPGQVDQAAWHIQDALPKLRAVFATGRETEESVAVTLYRGATPADRAQIVAAAKATHIPFQVSTSREFSPETDPLPTLHAEAIAWGVAGISRDGRALKISFVREGGTCEGSPVVHVIRQDATSIELTARQGVAPGGCSYSAGVIYGPRFVRLKAPVDGRSISGPKQIHRGFGIQGFSLRGRGMPRVIGLSVADAEPILRIAGFASTRIETTAPQGSIVAQRPRPGTKLVFRKSGRVSRAARLTVD